MAQDSAQPITTTEHVPAGGQGHGFPPFDRQNFPSQLFWLVLTFVALYVLMTRIALPRIESILAERRAREEADRREREAQQRADEEAKRQRELQEEKEHEFWHDTSTYGDATYWPWGSGIVYWTTVPVQPPPPARPGIGPGRGSR